jgi:hypothetical protein
VTWPGADSGFEADPYSPAGSLQREGLLFEGLRRRRGGRWLLVAIAGVIALPLIISFIVVIAHL